MRVSDFQSLAPFSEPQDFVRPEPRVAVLSSEQEEVIIVIQHLEDGDKQPQHQMDPWVNDASDQC